MLIYHAALAHFPKITYARYKNLKAYFFDLKNLWQAEFVEIVKAGLEEDITHEFLQWRDKNPVEQIIAALQKENIQTVSLSENGYPKLLREINDPPHTLFVRGVLPGDETPAVAVVGTRKLTPYGRMACEKIVGQLATRGLTIVSGLAFGIDGIAHETALNNRGITVAVLGSGVNNSHIYPVAHQTMAQKIIAAGGAVISEYPPYFEAKPYTFPERNRIIAGLTLGTLVIEAPAHSGALITAKYALDYNRDVFAVPHPINAINGVGPNNLIKLGAKLISEADDIIEALNLNNLLGLIKNEKPAEYTPTEEKILNCLRTGAKNIDLIIKETGLENSAVLSAITLMEIKGMARNLGGMNYCEK